MNFNSINIPGVDRVVAKTVATLSPEPGHKIPIANYKQVGQFCDVCEDVEAHVLNPETKKIRCLKCRTTKQLNY